jgi:hypothetical protein
LGTDLCLVRFRGRKLQRQVEVFEEVRLHELVVDFWKVDGRRARGRRPVQVSGKRLHLVAGLNLLHVVEVFGVEKLGAISASDKCVLDRNTFFMSGGVAPFQFGPTTM